MTDRAIPCVLMRGGTSKGPVFLADDLPASEETRREVLLRVMGSPDLRQIDGVGGATTVTSKVAIVSRSSEEGVDLDYLFAQVDPANDYVDLGPTCGNMLAAVGPFAVERGLCEASSPTTDVVIRAINTGAIVEATLQTPEGRIVYDGEQAIPGVPGTAAPVDLRFRDIVGAKTGSMLPTGCRTDAIQGVDVTCIDVGVPVVIAGAASLGKTGHEDPATLDADRDFMAQIEAIRCEAGKRMGLGDVSRQVLPKFAIVARSRGEARLASRYFTPWRCHPTYAVSGAIGVAVASLMPDTVASAVTDRGHERVVELEHAIGVLDVNVDATATEAGVDLHAAGIVRTARKLMAGEVFVPASVWPAGR